MSKKTNASPATSVGSKDSIATKKDKKGIKQSKVISHASLVEHHKDDASAKKSTWMAFSQFSKEDCEELLSMNVNEMESKLESMLSLKPTTDLKEAAILDYYVGAAYWGKQQGFSVQQFSGYLSVVDKLLNKIKDEHITLVDLLKEFRKLLVGIGAELNSDVESGGIEFFTVDQAKAITDYLRSSLFQHYKLYEFMFTKPQWEEIIGSDLLVEVPLPADTPFPPPLDEGISENTFKEFLMIPTPKLEDTTDTDEEMFKVMSPVQVELPPEAADLFEKLTAEDIKSIVDDVSRELLQNLQIGVESKIRNHENTVLSRINKIHNIIPENSVDGEEAPLQ